MAKDNVEHVLEQPEPISEEERQHRQHRKQEKELQISLARASRVKQQATEAYGILEDIRFDYLGDSAFRDKLTKTKKSLESFLWDFLLDDHYWREQIKEHRDKSPEEYDAELRQSYGDQSQ